VCYDDWRPVPQLRAPRQETGQTEPLTTNEKRSSMVAPCGLYCGACSILLAGQRADTGLLEQIAKVLSEQRGEPLDLPRAASHPR